MKNLHFIILFVLAVGLSSCALNYTYTYQPNPTVTGKAVFLPTIATQNTSVTLNDSLILERKYVKSLTLENLPEGDYFLHYSSYDQSYKDKLDEKYFFKIENGTKKVQIVAVPPSSTGFWIWAGLITSTIYIVLYMPLLFAY